MRIFNMLVVLLVGSLVLSGCATSSSHRQKRAEENARQEEHDRKVFRACNEKTSNYESLLCRRFFYLDVGATYRSPDGKRVVYAHTKDGEWITDAIAVNLDYPIQRDLFTRDEVLPNQVHPYFEQEELMAMYNFSPLVAVQGCIVVQGAHRQGEMISYSRFCMYTFKPMSVKIDFFEQMLSTKLFIQWVPEDAPMTIEAIRAKGAAKAGNALNVDKPAS